jgi:hypothetical protein
MQSGGGRKPKTPPPLRSPRPRRRANDPPGLSGVRRVSRASQKGSAWVAHSAFCRGAPAAISAQRVVARGASIVTRRSSSDCLASSARRRSRSAAASHGARSTARSDRSWRPEPVGRLGCSGVSDSAPRQTPSHLLVKLQAGACLGIDPFRIESAFLLPAKARLTSALNCTG